jgi:chemotaxis protein methyltransferase CheR
VENLTSEQIAKYFEITEKGYHFKPEIRSLVKFTRHDLITGFAYTGFDLIMCRNVLIYFNKKLQEIIFKKFHKSLNLKGILVLGKSEVISREARVLFQCVNRSTKIYRKRELQTGKKSIGEFSTEL